MAGAGAAWLRGLADGFAIFAIFIDIFLFLQFSYQQ
jgi:hypothetical protein